MPELDIEQYALMTELPAGELIGMTVGELTPPAGVDLEAVRRSGRVLRASEDLILEADDQLTLIGPAGGLPTSSELSAVLVAGEPSTPSDPTS